MGVSKNSTILGENIWFSVWNTSLKADPLISVLGATLNSTDKFQLQAVQFIVALAKKSILPKWKEESGPTFEMRIWESSDII